MPRVTAFSPSALRQSAITSPHQTRRSRPLYVFEVMAAVEAVEAVGTVGAVESAAAAGLLIQPSTSAFAGINTFFQTQPYLAAFLTCSFKASAADIIAQQQEVNKEGDDEDTPATTSLAATTTEPEVRVDFSRNLGFLLYGGLYTGMAQNYLFNVIYPAWIGSGDSWDIITKQVVADNLIFGPFLCLPLAYAFKAAFTSEEDLSVDTFRQGLEKYVEDVTTRGLLFKYWTIWIPVQFLTFGVIPPHFRVPFVAAISFFWIFILSTVAADESIEDSKVALSSD
jgi:hypothetical protein